MATKGRTNQRIKNHERTKMEHLNLPVNIRDIAKRLDENGYFTKIKSGGHLLVQSQNLSPENSILITRNNSYIEDVNLQSTAAIALYNEMKEEVLDTVNESHRVDVERNEAEVSATRIADISVLSATRDLVRTHMDLSADADLDTVFSGPKAKYQFLDGKGEDYLALSLHYRVSENDKNKVYPEIEARFGDTYGSTAIAYKIEDTELEAIKNGSFHLSRVAKEIDKLASIGMKERDSALIDLKLERAKNLLFDKQFVPALNQNDIRHIREFDGMDIKQFKGITDFALDYLAKDHEISMAEYVTTAMREDSKYSFDSWDEKAIDKLTMLLNRVEKDTNDLKISEMQTNPMDMAAFSCEKYDEGVISFDTKEKEPVNYDREWLNQVARLEDKLLELRHGPIQDMMDISKSIGRGTLELTQGILKFEVDGFNSGFDLGNGVSSIREGWAYGGMISALSKELDKISHSENFMENISFIDKSMDLKLLREEIRENANIYTKAAITLRENCDKMLDALKELQKDKTEKILTELRLADIKKQFKDYVQKFAEAFNKARTALDKINSDIHMLGQNVKTKALDAAKYTELRAKMVMNNTREAFNDIAMKAQLLLDMRGFEKECIAELLNDTKVEQAFGSLPYEQFVKAANARLWVELDGAMRAGKEAQDIPQSERSSEDEYAIRFGEQMKRQKEQGLFVAEGVRNEMKECLKDNVTYEQAIKRLAKTYNNESMAFRLRHSDSPIKRYDELSQVDKASCHSIIENLLKNMPEIESRLKNNEIDVKEARTKETQVAFNMER